MHFAVRAGHKDCMNILLQMSADPTISVRRNQTYYNYCPHQESENENENDTRDVVVWRVLTLLICLRLIMLYSLQLPVHRWISRRNGTMPR